MTKQMTRRVHIYKDGFGWSYNQNTPIERLTFAKNADLIPRIADGAVITFFNSTSAGDIEQVKEMAQELLDRATWHDNVED